ncbi:ABC transporter permease [Chungangia koreensis]|uniref:ABC transporter permease n=1 Tax=Chungangia koreensis TaxID=752657 RepID=A0ABV8X381_9LACT
MTFSWKRSYAIARKDFKDISKNLYVSPMFLFPPILAALYSRMGMDSLFGTYFVFIMAFTMVGTFMQSALIAEEKEKNTLRVLMLSPASAIDILGGKSLLSIVMTSVIVFISAFFLEYSPSGVVIAGILVSIILYVGIGTIMGLLTKSVVEASVGIMPIMLLFMGLPYLTMYIEKYPFLSVIEYMPHNLLFTIAENNQANFGNSMSELAGLLIWTVIIHVTMVVLYQKRLKD